MSYVSLVQDLPQEFQLPMLRLIEAVDKDLRDKLAVRRQDFDELRETVHELAEAQKRTEGRLDRLEVVVAKLAEAQKRTEQRVAELVKAQERTELQVAELVKAQERTEQQVAELIKAQERTEQAVTQLLTFQTRAEKLLQRLETRQNVLWGDQLERRYREKAYAYLGHILRRVRTVAWQDIEAVLEEHLSADEMADLLLLDVLVRGLAHRQPDAPEVWLAIEVSGVVDRSDVERARRRAALLRKIGYTVVPAVAGAEATAGGTRAAREGHVLLMQDGRRQFWEEALAEALSGQAGG